MFNLIGWVVLMAFFAILRRAAGNYGRWALVRKNDDNEAKWTQLFYAPDDVSVEDEGKAENGDVREAMEDSIDYAAEDALEDRRVGGWIRSIFTLTDEKYLAKILKYPKAHFLKICSIILLERYCFKTRGK